MTGLSLDPGAMAECLTAGGMEVEQVTAFGAGLAPVVAARVVGVDAHPNSNQLRLVTVTLGEEPGSPTQRIVCGAPLIPVPGSHVALAQPGTVLPSGVTIEAREVAGVRSPGMLCTEAELGVGENTTNLLELPDITAGESITAVCGVRDHILELGLTPNRPDALGHRGVARDLCVLCDHPIPAEAPHTYADPPVEASPMKVIISAPGLCSRYTAGGITEVTVGPSPFWMRVRLHRLGQRAICNVVDVTNWVLLEEGHPVHAFDFHRIDGGRLVVRRAEKGESLVTLDDEERPLEPDDLVIADAHRAQALAGIMGGAHSEVNRETTRVLVECARFHPAAIRRTAKRLGLHTDASHRFERGMDHHATVRVMERTRSLIQQVAGGHLAGPVYDLFGEVPAERTIAFSLPRANALLGVQIEPPRAVHILERLGCAVTPQGRHMNVTPPGFRPDLTIAEDLAEELVRVVGYDRVPATLPTVRRETGEVSRGALAVSHIKEVLCAMGLHEAITHAFVHPEVNRRATPPGREAVRLENPISEERSELRTSMVPGLLSVVERAHHHRVGSLAVYEYGRVFFGAPGQELPSEEEHVGIMLWGQRTPFPDGVGDHDVLDVKGMVTSLIRRLLFTEVRVRVPEHVAPWPWLHPKRLGEIVVRGTTVGHLGELHPRWVEQRGLTGRPIFAQLHADPLKAWMNERPTPNLRPLPRFPASERDVALVVPNSITCAQVKGFIKEHGGDELENVSLFDVYQGDSIPENHTSLAFRLTFRRDDGTLTDKRVDAVTRSVCEALKTGLGASIRQ